MNFEPHSNLKDQHAFLGASNWHWINYDVDKCKTVYANQLAKKKGTVLHAFAATCIKLNQKLPRSNKTLNMYVNDCISFKMKPEQIVYYSLNAFGTADAISFRNNTLRIFDLKTGQTPAHMEQLMIYAAFFCLEYGYKPEKIEIELRIYQNDEVTVLNPTSDQIRVIMDHAQLFDAVIDDMKMLVEDIVT